MSTIEIDKTEQLKITAAWGRDRYKYISATLTKGESDKWFFDKTKIGDYMKLPSMVILYLDDLESLHLAMGEVISKAKELLDEG